MPYTQDNNKMFRAYVSKKLIKESVETDPALIAKNEDPGQDGSKVTSKDKKAADYLSAKRQEIEDAINQKNKTAAEEEESKQNNIHGDALFIWDYLINKKKYSPQEAMQIVNMAKVAFEHLV